MKNLQYLQIAADNYMRQRWLGQPNNPNTILCKEILVQLVKAFLNTLDTYRSVQYGDYTFSIQSNDGIFYTYSYEGFIIDGGYRRWTNGVIHDIHTESTREAWLKVIKRLSNKALDNFASMWENFNGNRFEFLQENTELTQFLESQRIRVTIWC